MMHLSSVRRPVRKGLAAVAGGAMAFATLGAVGGTASAATGNSTPITYTVHPIAIQASSSLSSGGFVPSTCEKEVGLACYTPSIFHTAYQIPWTVNGEPAGTGTSVAIIDAYGSPTVAQDLATYDRTFGLPAANLHVYYPGGKPTYNPLQNHSETSWAEETSLDVQTVHALAPGATINLIVAANNAGNVLNNAEQYAIDNHLGDVMSMSFGSPEAAIAGGGNNLQLQQADAIYQQAAKDGISVFASSGDSGASAGYPTANASFPASDPYVTSTGGTDLFANDKGIYQSEYTWNDSDPSTCPFGCQYGVFGATGGAPSSVFARPAYQAGTGYATRTTSDVAFNASVYTATMIYLGFLGGNSNGFYFFGGTSEASPSWAAITADLDQAAGRDLGQMNPILYSLPQADFHDITVGNNALDGPGFAAGPGYDLPTGLGTPIVSKLMGSLAKGARLGYKA